MALLGEQLRACGHLLGPASDGKLVDPRLMPSRPNTLGPLSSPGQPARLRGGCRAQPEGSHHLCASAGTDLLCAAPNVHSEH